MESQVTRGTPRLRWVFFSLSSGRYRPGSSVTGRAAGARPPGRPSQTHEGILDMRKHASTMTVAAAAASVAGASAGAAVAASNDSDAAVAKVRVGVVDREVDHPLR
ncbi:hypothetical protein BN11_4280015 [Nostocoides australiense Ben110]|uniref:Uncharacterized protein n=1 Tax=Nostocoides australiense Ben110 TaxID=1193182 RepID=W6K438_9MICO|nr:hypothetical protein BN11_4280015 [Tetrasphaera australiensis Ben110]